MSRYQGSRVTRKGPRHRRLLLLTILVVLLVAGAVAFFFWPQISSALFPASAPTETPALPSSEPVSNPSEEPEATETPTPSEEPTATPLPTEEPTPEPSAETVLPQEWNLILVNADHPIPEGYADGIELQELRNDQAVDVRIYPELQQMFDDMREEGLYPLILSSFRTYEEQEEMLQSRIDAYINEGKTEDEARTLALEWVALPGTSEHELGLSIDINAEVDSQEQAVWDWLEENAYLYGFIQRYPPSKEEITGISHEPWHYRYVGKEDAAAIHEQGLCLEEYLPTLAQ